MSGFPFRPFSTVTIFANATSQSGAIDPRAQQIEVQNEGAVTCRIRWGVGAQTAVATDYPVLAGQSKLITIGSGNDTVAAISPDGTATLHVTGGVGE